MRTTTGRASTSAGLPRLARGQEFVSAGDIVNGARLERDSGSQESNDLELVRQSLCRHARVQRPQGDDGARQQLGSEGRSTTARPARRAAEGSTASPTSAPRSDARATASRRSKGVLKDYADSRFIDKVTPTLRRLRHAQPARSSSRWSISATTASARGWRAWSSTFRSPTRAGSAISSAGCRPPRSATASAPPASRPPRSTPTRGSCAQRIAALQELGAVRCQRRPAACGRESIAASGRASRRRAARCRFARR